MKKKEIFQEVLSTVADFCEVDVTKIMSKNREGDVVTARCLLITYAKSYGLSNKYIQEKLELRSHASISNYLNMYDSLKSHDKNFRHLNNIVGHELDNLLSF